MKVLISNTFENEDQELALKLQKILAQAEIEGYLAEKRKEYDLLIRDKIRKEIEDSDHMVAIITNNAIESASVNQELGYALREGIKPVILLEENAKIGVLTHGIEPELFQRDDFETHGKNVRDFLLRKGIRIKVTWEERDWIINSVYRPLYNEVTELENERVFITQKLSDPWTSVDNFSKFKLEPNIREVFGKLSEEIKKWNGMSVAKDREFSNKQVKLGQIFQECFAKAGLLKNDKEIILDDRSSQEPRSWVEAFKEVLLYEPDIKNQEDLYTKLYAHAILRDDEHSLWIKRFRMVAPKLFEYLFTKIPEARKVLELEITDKELLEQKNIIKKIVSELKIMLEEKFGLIKF